MPKLSTSFADFQSSYMTLSMTILAFLLVDLILNSSVDTDDLSVIAAPECAKSSNSTANANVPKNVCLDIPLAIYGLQIAFQFLCVWLLFLLLSGTTVFQVGLIGVLTKRFRSLGWLILFYITLTISLTGFRVTLLYENVQFQNLFFNQGYFALSTIQKLIAAAYYSAFVRAVFAIGDPMYYNMNKWLGPSGDNFEV